MSQTLRKLAIGVTATVTLVSAQPEAAGETGWTILVRVDNRMGVSADWLRGAQEEASRAYEAIGVSLLWWNNGTARPDRPAERMFDVVLGRSIRMTRAPREALGFAPLPNRAYVFADRVSNLAVSRREFEVVLGRVLAHELGHLLLPGQGHSDAGIMQKRVDYRSAHALGFTGEQRASIHALLATKASNRS